MGDRELAADPGEVAERLRAVLAEVGSGEITAELDHAAYLRGAADALAMVAEDCLDIFDSGRPGAGG